MMLISGAANPIIAKGDYRQAISDYRTYLNNTRQRNTDVCTHWPIITWDIVISNSKEYGEAQNRFRQYINLENNQQAPALADAYNRIGDCLYQNRQFAQAEENYTHAAQLQPSAGDYSVYQKGFLLGFAERLQG